MQKVKAGMKKQDLNKAFATMYAENRYLKSGFSRRNCDSLPKYLSEREISTKNEPSYQFFNTS